MKVRTGVLVSVALLAVSVLVVTGADRATAQQQTVVITIGIDANGDVTASPDRVTVQRDQAVEWAADTLSAVKDFTVRFQSATPFGNAAARAGIRGRRKAKGRGRVTRRARVGWTYKYTIGVWDGQNVRVVDPEIIIGPS
ncbi:MAG: hypothetical protein ACE5HQ_04460 [Gemmatimonadota bacterium]